MEEIENSTLEEVNSLGEGSGLEFEKPEENDGTSKHFKPEDIDVITQSRTIDLLLTRLREGELDLSPDFQRRENLWNDFKKSSLIESLLLRIPIPSLYVSEDKDGDYTVVDGLQRLCAIAHFIDVDALNNVTKSSLRPLQLKGLESFKEHTNKTFSELPRILQRRISETELTLHVIRASTPPEVKFNIFSRINQGGLALAAQEIRNAIYPGEWNHHINKMADSEVFVLATGGKIKGERMQDLELVLRFVALYGLAAGKTRPADQNLDDFLNETVEKMFPSWTREKWEEIKAAFERALYYADKVFGKDVFRKPSLTKRSPINRGLFEAQTVAIARCDDQKMEQLVAKSSNVIQALARHLEQDKSFNNALTAGTGKGSSSNKRLEVMEKIFSEITDA